MKEIAHQVPGPSPASLKAKPRVIASSAIDRKLLVKRFRTQGLHDLFVLTINEREKLPNFSVGELPVKLN
jgi:hypothetical protein